MGFAAISHYVPNILPIMMCCILLLFYMLIKYFVISCNRQSICKTEKQAIFFPSLNAFRRILPQCLLFFLFFFLLLGTQVQAIIPCGSCIPTKEQALLLSFDLALRTPLGF